MIYYTDAPPSYDYNPNHWEDTGMTGVLGIAKGKPIRRCEIEDGLYEMQRQRNLSGLYTTLTEHQFQGGLKWKTIVRRGRPSSGGKDDR